MIYRPPPAGAHAARRAAAPEERGPPSPQRVALTQRPVLHADHRKHEHPWRSESAGGRDAVESEGGSPRHSMKRQPAKRPCVLGMAPRTTRRTTFLFVW